MTAHLVAQISAVLAIVRSLQRFRPFVLGLVSKRSILPF